MSSSSSCESATVDFGCVVTGRSSFCWTGCTGDKKSDSPFSTASAFRLASSSRNLFRVKTSSLLFFVIFFLINSYKLSSTRNCSKLLTCSYEAPSSTHKPLWKHLQANTAPSFYNSVVCISRLLIRKK